MTLRYRQIHLDFHTSELIVGIGDRFDPDEFADTLVKAHVNSITCFARCHHGMIYYDTQKFPERRHPHLTRNLLKEQIDACHARDIRVPIYITVQWDQFTANEHPEWLALDADGKVKGTPPYEAGFYRYQCVNSPYFDFLKAHVDEVMSLLPTDGIFFDIVQPLDDSSKWTRAQMVAAGLEPSDEAGRKRFGIEVINTFEREMTAFVRERSQDCTIFYNAGHVGPRHRAALDAFSHFEVESLPSGGWGYSHFPLASRYARTLGHEVLGMTGKFHTSWGDFHSYKNKAALQFECFHMLANGAKCSIGDQLHPNGVLDAATYDLIGTVYGEVEQKEQWVGTPLAEVGIFTPEEFTREQLPTAASGANRIMQEGAQQYDFIDSAANFMNYHVLILPDNIPVSEPFTQKLNDYLAHGGSLIASYQSGMDADHTRFTLDALGVEYRGDAPYSPDFILPRGEIGTGLPESEHVMYKRGLEVKTLDGTEILANTINSYFDRTYKHFSSHKHSPSSGEVGAPAIMRRGNVIYFSHPIFSQYDANAPLWCKTLVLNALKMLLPTPMLKHDGPSTLIATVQSLGEGKEIVHLLHYVPVRRSQDIDIVEDVIPLHDVIIQVRQSLIRKVYLVPEGTPLDYTRDADYVSIHVPRINGHQMIAIEYDLGS
ncbi:MAG TPA: alpha-amylase family protein [Phototrophicaceae bacterium]|nr:alpha-amylase family protein [Phototrophicaceae bacterium]